MNRLVVCSGKTCKSLVIDLLMIPKEDLLLGKDWSSEHRIMTLKCMEGRRRTTFRMLSLPDFPVDTIFSRLLSPFLMWYNIQHKRGGSIRLSLNSTSLIDFGLFAMFFSSLFPPIEDPENWGNVTSDWWGESWKIRYPSSIIISPWKLFTSFFTRYFLQDCRSVIMMISQWRKSDV